MLRRAMAGAAAVLVLILFALLVRGCLGQREERAVKDYVRDVGVLVQDSGQQSKALFDLLSSRGGRSAAVSVENSLNGFRVQSAQLVDRARDTKRPGELGGAHDYLLETLEFRRDALAAIADGLPTALGDQERREGTRKVAAQMQAFLTSDVLYTQRFVPRLQEVLRSKDLADKVRIPRSQFFPDIEWLQPSFVSERVSGIRTGRGADDRTTAPGLHGSGIGTVTLGGQALTQGGTVTVKLSGSLSLQVQVMNQGESTETDVPVRVRIGKGADAIKVKDSLDSIAAGETKSVEVSVADRPPTGQNVPVEVEVEAVPGEKMTDNNKQTFSVIFTR